MQSDHQMERLARITGEVPVVDAPFDVDDEVQVDRAASALLRRFRSDGEFEAFSLLFELAYPRLREMAEQLTRDTAVPIDPDDLVSTLMTRLFTDVRRPVGEVRHFLGWAHVSMRNDLLDQWRRLKRARRHDPVFQDRLASPDDPARRTEEQEQDEMLARIDREFFELVDACFHELDARSRRVLIAREMLGLSYERVAALLELSGAQVGMIIKRARQQLVERVVRALRESHADDASWQALVGGSDGESVRRLLTSRLTGKGGDQSIAAVVGRLAERATDSGRERLAELVHEMAKSCMMRIGDFADRTRVHARPRRVPEVANEIRALSTRLDAADVAAPVPAVLSEPTDDEAALVDAAQCLSVLESLEGTSGRQQVLTALHRVYSGRPEEGERILRGLDSDGHPPRTRCRASVNLALTLLRQERYEEARVVSQDAVERWPDNPVPCINLLYATARLGDREGFEQAAVRLFRAQRTAASPWVAQWVQDNLAELVGDVGLTRDKIDVWDEMSEGAR